MSVGNSEMSCYQILETSRVYSVIRHDVRHDLQTCKAALQVPTFNSLQSVLTLKHTSKIKWLNLYAKVGSICFS